MYRILVHRRVHLGQRLACLSAGLLITLCGMRPGATGAITGPPRDVSTNAASLLSQADELEGRQRPLSAARIYRTILLEHDPEHALARKKLRSVMKRIEPATTAEGETLVQARLGEDFQRLLSPHFVIYSNGRPEWTRDQIARLERACDEFLRFTDRIGIESVPLTDRLLCILFDDAEQFRQYARTHDGIDQKWVAGYYASAPNYVVFYDCANGPMFDEAKKGLLEGHGTLNEYRQKARDARTARRTEQAAHYDEIVRDLQSQIAAEEKRLTMLADHAATAKTIHEAVHQLAFNTGLQTRFRTYPFWISEGLATTFESATVNAAIGPWIATAEREEALARIVSEQRLIPLRELVGMEDVADGSSATAEAMYHQSYALVSWLCQYRTEDLRRYLLAMAQPPSNDPDSLPGSMQRNDHVRIFAASFGSIDRLEREWLNWVRQRLESRKP